MENHAITPHEALGYLALVLFIGLCIAFGIMFCLKNLFHGFTKEKEVPPFSDGDECPYCASGVLRVEHVQADPDKVQLEKQILRCVTCRIAVEGAEEAIEE